MMSDDVPSTGQVPPQVCSTNTMETPANSPRKFYGCLGGRKEDTSSDQRTPSCIDKPHSLISNFQTPFSLRQRLSPMFHSNMPPLSTPCQQSSESDEPLMFMSPDFPPLSTPCQQSSESDEPLLFMSPDLHTDINTYINTYPKTDLSTKLETFIKTDSNPDTNTYVNTNPNTEMSTEMNTYMKSYMNKYTKPDTNGYVNPSISTYKSTTTEREMEGNPHLREVPTTMYSGSDVSLKLLFCENIPENCIFMPNKSKEEEKTKSRKVSATNHQNISNRTEVLADKQYSGSDVSRKILFNKEKNSLTEMAGQQAWLTGQPTGQPIGQSTGQSTGRSAGQSFEQPTGQPLARPRSQLLAQPAGQTFAEPPVEHQSMAASTTTTPIIQQVPDASCQRIPTASTSDDQTYLPEFSCPWRFNQYATAPIDYNYFAMPVQFSPAKCLCQTIHANCVQPECRCQMMHSGFASFDYHCQAMRSRCALCLARESHFLKDCQCQTMQSPSRPAKYQWQANYAPTDYQYFTGESMPNAQYQCQSLNTNTTDLQYPLTASHPLKNPLTESQPLQFPSTAIQLLQDPLTATKLLQQPPSPIHPEYEKIKSERLQQEQPIDMSKLVDPRQPVPQKKFGDQRKRLCSCAGVAHELVGKRRKLCTNKMCPRQPDNDLTTAEQVSAAAGSHFTYLQDNKLDQPMKTDVQTNKQPSNVGGEKIKETANNCIYSTQADRHDSEAAMDDIVKVNKSAECMDLRTIVNSEEKSSVLLSVTSKSGKKRYYCPYAVRQFPESALDGATLTPDANQLTRHNTTAVNEGRIGGLSARITSIQQAILAALDKSASDNSKQINVPKNAIPTYVINKSLNDANGQVNKTTAPVILSATDVQTYGARTKEQTANSNDLKTTHGPSKPVKLTVGKMDSPVDITKDMTCTGTGTMCFLWPLDSQNSAPNTSPRMTFLDYCSPQWTEAKREEELDSDEPPTNTMRDGTCYIHDTQHTKLSTDCPAHQMGSFSRHQTSISKGILKLSNINITLTPPIAEEGQEDESNANATSDDSKSA